MKYKAKDLIKLLLSKECLTQKELVDLMNAKMNKRYSPDGFSHKLSRGTIDFDEIAEILELLGYELEFKKIEN